MNKACKFTRLKYITVLNMFDFLKVYASHLTYAPIIETLLDVKVALGCLHALFYLNFHTRLYCFY